MITYPWPAAFPVNEAKARAVVEFMDCPPEREAELAAVINRPAGIVRTEPAQGRLLV